jgi:hypothetical protein
MNNKKFKNYFRKINENDFLYKKSKSNLNIHLIEYLLFFLFFLLFFNLFYSFNSSWI